MRIIIAIILIFQISVSFLLAQDIEPEEQFVFTCPFTSETYTVSSDNIQQKGFLLGWHWGLGQRMSEALEMSQSHVGSLNTPDELKSEYLDLVVFTDIYDGNDEINEVSGNGHTPCVLEAQSIHYEPTLEIYVPSTSTPPSFTPWEDTDGVRSVFGFQNING
jgi:hypothetical protein